MYSLSKSLFIIARHQNGEYEKFNQKTRPKEIFFLLPAFLSLLRISVVNNRLPVTAVREIPQYLQIQLYRDAGQCYVNDQASQTHLTG